MRSWPLILALLLFLLLLPLAACSAPGAEVRPGANDFAFLEIQLEG